jgi:hypothetical protein
MRTSARAAAAENKAVTSTTKQIALFVKTRPVLSYRRLLRLLTSHQ